MRLNSIFLLFLMFISLCSNAQQKVNAKDLKRYLQKSGDVEVQDSNTQIGNDDVHVEECEFYFYADKGDFALNRVGLGYSSMNMELEGMQNLKSYAGVFFNIGREYFFDKNKFWGFDVLWLDLNYNNYKLNFISNVGTDKVDYHKGDISVQFGPLLRFEFGNVGVKAFARYAPSYTFLYDDFDFYSSYVSYVIFGTLFTYHKCGLGFEYRTGKGKFYGQSNESKDAEAKHRGWNVSFNVNF